MLRWLSGKLVASNFQHKLDKEWKKDKNLNQNGLQLRNARSQDIFLKWNFEFVKLMLNKLSGYVEEATRAEHIFSFRIFLANVPQFNKGFSYR